MYIVRRRLIVVVSAADGCNISATTSEIVLAAFATCFAIAPLAPNKKPVPLRGTLLRSRRSHAVGMVTIYRLAAFARVLRSSRARGPVSASHSLGCRPRDGGDPYAVYHRQGGAHMGTWSRCARPGRHERRSGDGTRELRNAFATGPIVHAFAVLREDLDARQRRQVYAVCASLTVGPGMTIGGSSPYLSSYVPPGELLHHTCVPHL